MTTLTGVISYPVPPYSNVAIEPQFYEPSRFEITGITRGQTTIVTTAVAHNYVVGQEVRLIMPVIYGSYQLNETQGYVLSIPSTTQVEVAINSSLSNAFRTSPYSAVITNISNSNPAVVTASNNFLRGNVVVFSQVSGMTEINTLVAPILTVSSSSFTVSIDTSAFTTYGSGGVVSLYNVPQNLAQILAIGDINSGVSNANGNLLTGTFIPGSFINISPL